MKANENKGILSLFCTPHDDRPTPDRVQLQCRRCPKSRQHSCHCCQLVTEIIHSALNEFTYTSINKVGSSAAMKMSAQARNVSRFNQAKCFGRSITRGRDHETHYRDGEALRNGQLLRRTVSTRTIDIRKWQANNSEKKRGAKASAGERKPKFESLKIFSKRLN